MLYVVLALCISLASSQLDIIEVPSDVAARNGQTAEIICHINPANSGSHLIQWIGFASRPNVAGGIISANEQITIDITGKYSINMLKPYSLQIAAVDTADAGQYRCNDAFTNTAIGGFDPTLVTVDPAPCPFADGGTLSYTQNDTIAIEWSVSYAGNSNNTGIPYIGWTLGGEIRIPVADDSTAGIHRSTFLQQTVTSSDNNKQLVCSLDYVGIQQTCTTTLSVQYPATKPTFSINGNAFPDTGLFRAQVGESLTAECTSDGNPQPAFNWNYQPEGGSFGPDEAGSVKQLTNIQQSNAGVYRCCANNNLNGYRECSQFTMEVIDPGTPVTDCNYVTLPGTTYAACTDLQGYCTPDGVDRCAPSEWAGAQCCTDANGNYFNEGEINSICCVP